jgi:predicted Zn-dependent peptidase
LTIIKELLLNPAFDAAELEKKKPSLVQLSSKKESPRSVIGPYFDTLLYGTMHMEIVMDGNTTVSKLTMNDLKDFIIQIINETSVLLEILTAII